jgi:hypothetical protein
LRRFKQRIRDVTRRAKGVSMKKTIAELAPYEFNNPPLRVSMQFAFSSLNET